MPELTVADQDAWREWLAAHVDEQPGVWLALARKGVTGAPTRLTREPALEEALCQGWIDGQARSRDDVCYLQRFTPRRARSLWSTRNVGIIAELTAQGRMRPAGLAEVERAQADGRWDAAYAGPATIEVPPELEASPAARAGFDALPAQDRYAVLHRITIARKPETKLRLSAQWAERLARGETP